MSDSEPQDRPQSTHKKVGRSSSQSLFQIYYLGRTRVDRRCSNVVMPWVIEELKLKTHEMKFLWLTPGPETVSYVADSGQELFSHSYNSILQCCIAVDGISFAYIARSGDDNKYYCHVFQALTYEEAEAIMSRFKVHAREEVSIGATISQNKLSDLPTKSSGLIFQTSLKHHPPDSKPPIHPQGGSEFHVHFLGKFEVESPSTSSETQVQTIDRIVMKLKDSHNLTKPRRTLGSLIRGKKSTSGVLKSSSHSSLGSDDVDMDTHPNATPTNEVLDGVSTSSSVQSQESAKSSNVSIRVTSSSPDPTREEGGDEVGHVVTTEHVQNGDISQAISEKEQNSETTPHDEVDGVSRLDSTTSFDGMDFDTIPELSTLQDSAVFQSLSGSQTLPSRRVRLVFSGITMMLMCEDSGERIMKKSIRNIACCAQGKKEPEYFAFTSSSKEGGVKKYHCHLFLCDNKKMVVKILETFKSSFVHALSVGMPAALCDSCPLQQLHTLCKNLEGVSTQVAQSIIQECLTSFNEADYTSIMEEYKLSEHADHEYTQIIVLVGLIRQCFQSQQELHTHTGIGGTLPSGSSLDQTASRLRLPALIRAKNAITSSFENLKNKPTDRNSRFFKVKSIDKPNDGRVSQSLNVRPASPLFSKKAALDTLMAPIATSPVKEPLHEDIRRTRTWSGFMKKPPRSLPSSSLNPAEGGQEELPPESTAPEVEIKRSSPVVTSKENVPVKKHATFQMEDDLLDNVAKNEFKTPITPVRKIRKRRPTRERHSLTPPARTEMMSKYRTHRRATSYALGPYTTSSWRQEIFESCNTPERRKGSQSSDFLEDFEIIDLDQGGSWRFSRASFKKTLDESESSSPRTRARKRWKDAIDQQIILNRMEKQNKEFMKASGDAELKRVKLCYSSPELDSKEAIQEWNTVLTNHESMSDTELRSKAIKGIPPSKRAEVWPVLAQRYQVRTDSDWTLPFCMGEGQGLQQLLNEETDFEHSIVVDLGRTFPNHPYFTHPMDGQVSLRNVLHSYAVADPETGYCQGLSFVAGIILMHTKNDDSAFELLYQLMTLYNYREIYFENLTNLQMRLYQLSRLLHDFNPSLYQHFRDCDITPFFYAAPWFLTIFASQFPVAFTARVFDLILCDGTDFILKVVLALLQINEEAILECEGMEITCKYLKTTLPDLALERADEIFKTASKIDFGSRLGTFESEYDVMAELNSSFKSELVIDDFPSVTEVLKRQNVALIEQLAICHASNSKLESVVESLQSQMAVQNQRLQELEAKLESMQSTPTTTQSSSETESLTTNSTQ